jgi:hypothetical protein
MTQPSGKVCGLPEQYRTYLRSSPIFCVFDAFAIVIRFIIYLLFRFPPRKALRTTLSERFSKDEIVCLDGGFQALERLTWVRWLLFSLGTLPQVIKLFALQGVPWTQGWGTMFLASFLILELFSLAWQRNSPRYQSFYLVRMREAITASLRVVLRVFGFVGRDEGYSLVEEALDSRKENRFDLLGGNELIQRHVADREPGIEDNDPCLVELPDASGGREPARSREDQQLQYEQAPPERHTSLNNILAYLDWILAGMAFLLQWSILVWAYDKLARPLFDLTYIAHKPAWLISLYHPGYLLFSIFLAYMIVFQVYIAFVIACILLTALIWLLCCCRKKVWEIFEYCLDGVIHKNLAIFWGVVSIIAIPFSVWMHVQDSFHVAEVQGGWFWEILTTLPILTFLIRLTWFATEKQPLRRKLGLLNYQRYSGDNERQGWFTTAFATEAFAVGSFFTFILSIIFCTLWYKFRYDPHGTIKPSWTDILG